MYLKEPKVSIVILNWNGLPDTIECLNSLKKIDYKNYTVFVVDNGSRGNDAEILFEKYGSQITLIANDKNYGFAEGNNIAIRKIMDINESRYILLLNNDTIVSHYFLNELVKIINRDESIGIVGPTIYYYDKPEIVQSAGGLINIWTGRRRVIGQGKHEKELNNEVKEVDYIMGAALLIKTKTIDKIGLLDKDYFAYTEDVDWCYRAKKNGYKIYHVPNSKVYHKESASTGGHLNAQVLFYIYRNSIIFMRKNACFYHWFTFIPISLVYFIKRMITSSPKKIYSMGKGLIYGFLNKKVNI